MKLSRKSPIVRWAYLIDSVVPHRTSLCAIFWRSVVLTPVCAVAVIAVLFVFARAVWLYPWRAAAIVASVVGILIAIGVIAFVGDWLDRRKAMRHARTEVEPSTFAALWEGAKAVKQRVCPLVTIE